MLFHYVMHNIVLQLFNAALFFIIIVESTEHMYCENVCVCVCVCDVIGAPLHYISNLQEISLSVFCFIPQHFSSLKKIVLGTLCPEA